MTEINQGLGLRIRRTLIVSTALPLLCGPGLPAFAQVWDGGAGTSDWHDAANWAGDTLPVTGTAVNIVDADVILNGSSATTGALTLGYAVVDGTNMSGNGTLTLNNGASLATTGAASINPRSGAENSITLNRASAWSVTENLTVASGGTGRLSIEEGSRSTVGGNVVIASASNATGTISVDGAGSGLIATGTITMSRNASAVSTLVIANGANVSGSQLIFYSGTGTLVFGAAAGEAAVGAGTLSVASGINFRQGTSTVVFNHIGTAGDPLVFDATLSHSSAEVTIDQIAGVTEIGNSNTAFTATTRVSGGALLVTGSLGGTANVWGAGTLGGTGTLGAVNVYAGGTLSPGRVGEIGTLTVKGDLILANGSTYAVDVGATGVSDLTVVSGTAYISDGSAIRVTPVDGVSYASGWSYRVLEAGAISGAFSGASQVTGDFATFTTSYSATDVTLSIASLEGTPTSITTREQTVNQQSVAGAIDSIGQNTTLFNAIYLSNAGESIDALNALSADIYPSTRTALLAESQFLRAALNNRLRYTFGDVSFPAGEEGFDPETPRAWGEAFGSSGKLDGDGNAGALDTSMTGFILGFDAVTESGLHLGFAGAKTDTSYDSTKASADGSSYHLALYGGAEWGALTLRSGLTWGRSKVSVARSVDVDLITNSNFADSMTGEYRANTRQAFAELAYTMDRGALRLEPFAGLAHVKLDTDLMNEQGGPAALTVDEAGLKTTFTTLGIRAAQDLEVGASRAVLSGSLGWRHAFGDTESASVHAFSSGDAFTVYGVAVDQNVAVIEAGIDMLLSPNATLGIAYSGQQGSKSSKHGLNARFNLRF